MIVDVQFLEDGLDEPGRPSERLVARTAAQQFGDECRGANVSRSWGRRLAVFCPVAIRGATAPRRDAVEASSRMVFDARAWPLLTLDECLTRLSLHGRCHHLDANSVGNCGLPA